eukprot:143347_1
MRIIVSNHQPYHIPIISNLRLCLGRSNTMQIIMNTMRMILRIITRVHRPNPLQQQQSINIHTWHAALRILFDPIEHPMDSPRITSQTESKTIEDNDENKDRTQTGSTNTNSSDTSSVSSLQSDHDNEDEHAQQQTQPFLYQTQPFLNVLSLINQPNVPRMNHLAFCGVNVPPPLPVPYPDLNRLNNTQFSFAAIVNHSSNDGKNCVNENKKNIIPMSFPPLPTNNHIMDHLDYNFDHEDSMDNTPANGG